MLGKIYHWWQQRIIRQSGITEDAWVTVFRRLPILERLTKEEKIRLQKLAILLLHKKTFSGTHGLEITQDMRLIVALQACLPILNLGMRWYRGWHSIIIYPSGFRASHTFMDEAGVVHHGSRALSGEAWDRGPVILSWDATEQAAVIDGENLVIHEFAHKLDMRNGATNGFPPLHKGVNGKQWSKVFTAAYDDLDLRIQRGKRSRVDHYAIESPAEFFSVFSELFFERPAVIVEEYPDVYKLLSQFYKQDTLKRLSH